MKKTTIIIDAIIVILMTVIFIYNIYAGISNHDSYYLLMGLLDYIVIHLGAKNIEDNL